MKRTATVLGLTAALLAGAAPALAQTSDTSTATIDPKPAADNCPILSEVIGTEDEPATIQAGGLGLAKVTGTPGQTFTLTSYSAPESVYTPYVNGVIPADGSWEYDVIAVTNSRFSVESPCRTTGNASRLLKVNTFLTLDRPQRVAERTYRFTGRHQGHAGDYINLYREDAQGRKILTAQTRAKDDFGTWSLTRRFSGTGTFVFTASTGSERINGAGVSERVRLSVR